MQLYLKSLKGILMRIFITVVLLCIALLSFYTQVDDGAMKIYDETLDRAVYSFAIVKALNAIISVIQSTEINLSLFVGATVGVGEILDPVNDLVERFSVVMLFASVSIGIQHLLLILGKSLFVKVLLSVGVLISIISLWVNKTSSLKIFLFSIKFVVLVFILRFGAVIFIHATEFIYTEVYAQEYKQSNDYIQGYKNDLEVIRNNKQEFDSLWVKLKSKTEVFSKKVIKLITIFVVTTILFPILFLWFFIFLVKLIFNMRLDYDKMPQFLKKEIV